MSHKVRRWVKAIGWCAFVLTSGGVAAFFVALDHYSAYQLQADRFALSALANLPERSAIFDRHGVMYSYIDGENRITVPLKSISPEFLKAIIAREDAKFWKHNGIDYEGIMRAAVTNFQAGEIRQGGSTITQQLARNTFHLTGRNLERKALEAALAQRIEQHYSKDQILEFYVNRIYFGSGFYGVEAASRGYFGKSSALLSLPEAATLAALVCSPNRFDPTKNPQGAESERNILLDRMVELGMIGSGDAVSAKAARLNIRERSELAIHDDYVVDAINRELSQLLTADVINFGGLKIYSTIDVELQRNTQSAVDRQLTEVEHRESYPHPKKENFEPKTDSSGKEKPTNYLQAAAVVVENASGGIRAIVGGRDYTHSRYPRATLAKRQIGSTFKPFVYATAFERGLLPGMLVDDSQITPGAFRPLAPTWSPKNSDGKYLGYQRADFGLIKSRNTMTVRVGQMVGIPLLKRVSDALGIGGAFHNYPSVYIGGFETTLRDLTAAYTVFPNQGVFRRSYLITRIEDHTGTVLYAEKTAPRRIFSADVAWMTNSILQQIMKTGTAAKAASLGWKKPAGGKTGTTDEFRDAWFVGYTSSLTCGVWVGLDQPETIMEKGYGSALALPVWVDVMNSVPDLEYPAEKMEPAMQLVRVQICSASGRRATSQCSAYCNVTTEVLPASRANQYCTLHPEFAPPPIAEYTPQAPPITSQDLYRPRTEPMPPPAEYPQQNRQIIEQTPRGFRIWNLPPYPR